MRLPKQCEHDVEVQMSQNESLQAGHVSVVASVQVYEGQLQLVPTAVLFPRQCVQAEVVQTSQCVF